ncbi:preprotein translocase subunit SecG [candidate division Kazan bacterium RBG_13_50_9]|uniref:Protein-export membrane protein SecG n=1 Tax=candidate division Kazan bacterium RBG_13_50_9 TaxID=1798535 RepID=A0A1F4NSQ0_UNCK3|nr:MAG: preprotein translocase subunit SecG [candidate division Kazan bacterium RBG_13_50_9]
MSLDKALIIIQVVLAILLMASILIQSRGASLGEAFGGSSTFYGTRRGSERTLFIITVVLAALFVLIALAILFI